MVGYLTTCGVSDVCSNKMGSTSNRSCFGSTCGRELWQCSWVGVYCSQLLKRQKALGKYVNRCELTISTKPSIILDVLQHKVVLGNSRFVGGLYD